MKIATVTLNSAGWTDIVSPDNTDNLNILNISGQVMAFRIDKNDASTEFSNIQDMQYALPELPAMKNTPSPRFKKDQVVGSGKLSSGSGDCKVFAG